MNTELANPGRLRMSKEDELAVTESLREGQGRDGSLPATSFLRLALIHGYNAYDYFDIVGDSWVTTGFVNTLAVERYDQLQKAHASLEGDPSELTFDVPAEVGITHTITDEGEIVVLSGRGQLLDMGHTCRGLILNEKDFSQYLLHRQATSAINIDTSASRHMILTSDTCNQEDCVTFSYYAFTEEDRAPLFAPEA